MNKKVLVIDDDDDVCNLISFRLAKQGFEVRSALDGITGIAIANEFVPDLIILDIMMPVMDGFEVAKNLKEHRITANIPIMLCTAMANSDLKQRSSDIKAAYCITKPFESKDLIEKVMDVLDWETK